MKKIMAYIVESKTPRIVFSGTYDDLSAMTGRRVFNLLIDKGLLNQAIKVWIADKDDKSEDPPERALEKKVVNKEQSEAMLQDLLEQVSS